MAGLSNRPARESVPPVTRVVYVVESPFTPRDGQRFGLTKMREAGFDVLVWELAPIYLPGSETSDPERAPGVEIHRMLAISDLYRAARGLSASDLVILLCGTQRRQLRRYRGLHAALGPTPSRLATIVGGHTPSLAPPRLPWFPTREAARDFIAHLRNSVMDTRPVSALMRRWNRLCGIRPLDFAWVGTTDVSLDRALLTCDTRVRRIHAFDYDLVLALEPDVDPSARGVVFLDSMGPLHPDYGSLGEESNRPAVEPYFETIRTFLDRFERSKGSRVSVAAHPRAVPGSLEPWYGGRTVVYGQTANCIAQSTLAIVPNNSTAVNFIVALGKPCIFVTSTAFDPILAPYVRNLSRLLRAPLEDADQLFSAGVEAKVDEGAYARFMWDYVKRPETPKRPFWEVVVRDISGTDLSGH